jgi:hypothetical protein
MLVEREIMDKAIEGYPKNGKNMGKGFLLTLLKFFT